ncbi:MAG: glycosyltransferase family 2 protein [Chitinophagaceae bacterium]
MLLSTYKINKLDISIIIVSYNVKYFLEQCLCSIKLAIQNLDAEVFVIDNCSSDGSLEYLKPRFNWVQFIQNDKNDGFGKANNKVLSICNGRYIIFLNPDTLLAEKTLEKCIQVFSNDQRCGTVGVRMLDGHGNFLAESKRAIPAAGNTFYKLAGLAGAFPRSKIFNNYALGNLQEDELNKVPVLSGAFMMVQKKLLDETGGYDETYFMYGEDIDLSYRLLKTGHENIYAGQIPIIHFKGESTNKNESDYAKRFYGAMDIFVSKHYAGKSGIFKKAFLKTGISAASFLYKMKLLFSHKERNSKNKRDETFIFYLTGDTQGIEESRSMLLKSGVREDNMSVVQTLNNLKSLSNNSAIVFCIGSLTLEEAMSYMEHFSQPQYFFHYSGSNSIIGSNDKNNAGIFYSN